MEVPTVRVWYPSAQDGDGITGGIGGRRSRKRAAPAMVGELQGAPGKLASSLPGRRARNDEEDEGFVVAMSQQVSRLYCWGVIEGALMVWVLEILVAGTP